MSVCKKPREVSSMILTGIHRAVLCVNTAQTPFVEAPSERYTDGCGEKEALVLLEPEPGV